MVVAVDFEPEQPNFSAQGDLCVGPCLRELDLSHNSVQWLRSLQAHPLIQRLDLSHNSLAGGLQALSALVHLEWLDVSHNEIASDDGLVRLPLRHLNLSHNRVIGRRAT